MRFLAHLKSYLRDSQEIKTQLRYELSIFKVAWPWLLLGVFFQLFHNAMHNLVYYIASEYDVFGGPDNKIMDIGFEFLPEIDINKLAFYPNNGLLYTVFLMGFVFFIWPIFVKSPSYSAVQAGWRTVLVLGMCIVLRVSSFIFTVLPSPGTHCAEYAKPGKFDDAFDPPDGAEIFTRFSFDNGCSDLIFSSHLMYALALTLSMCAYTRNLWLGLVSWSLCIALAFVIIMQRSHYTVDVIVGLYAVPLTWVAFRHFVPWDISEHVAFWRDQPIVRYSAKSAAQSPSDRQSSD